MSDQSKPVWKLLGVSLGLAALVWVVFGQTLTHGFVNFDDGTYVYRNPDVTQGITADGIKWAFSHVVAANWHPLTMLSHMLDCQMYGVTPAGHHFTNVLLHTVATILLLLVLDYWPLNLFGSTTAARLFLEKLPLLLLTTAACVETILSQHQSINLIKTVSLETRIANAFIALMIYIRQTFWPANLAVFYP